MQAYWPVNIEGQTDRLKYRKTETQERAGWLEGWIEKQGAEQTESWMIWMDVQIVWMNGWVRSSFLEQFMNSSFKGKDTLMTKNGVCFICYLLLSKTVGNLGSSRKQTYPLLIGRWIIFGGVECSSVVWMDIWYHFGVDISLVWCGWCAGRIYAGYMKYTGRWLSGSVCTVGKGKMMSRIDGCSHAQPWHKPHIGN